MNEESLTQYIKTAFECKDAGNYKQAIEYFYKALNIDNESSEIMSEIANLYFKINNPERAIEYYEQALEVEPFNLDIKFNLALVYKYIGNIQKSIDFIESVYFKSHKLEYLVELLHALFLEGKNEEVLDLFAKSEFKESDSSLLFQYVGLACKALGKLDDAEIYLRKVISLDKDNNDTKYELADILFVKKSYEESELLLLAVLENKICSKSYFLLGEINFVNGRLDKAINYFSIASNIEFKNPIYFYELATAYSLKGFFKEAEENYLAAIKLSPNNLHYNYTLAYLYYQIAELSKSKQKIAYILDINPRHSDSLVLQAMIAIEEDDIMTATKNLDIVFADNALNDFAYYVKALLYKKLNWWDKAIEAISKALESKPESIEYLSELAAFYYEAKFYGDTKTICKKILSIDSKYIYAYILAAKAFMQSKDAENALKNLDIAISLDINSDEAYYIKAKVYKQNYLNNSAIDTAKKAIAIAPSIVQYYDFVAHCYYDVENYKDAFIYFKEAATLDIRNVSYKYYMAKCSQLTNDVPNAISNFSMAKRLEPSNVDIAIDYADFLCSIKKYKKALEVLNSTLDYSPITIDKEKLFDKKHEVKSLMNENSGVLKKLFSGFKSKKTEDK